MIRIADKSLTGWTTVREYESDDLASDSEDEKRMHQAEPAPYGQSKRNAMHNLTKKLATTVSNSISKVLSAPSHSFRNFNFKQRKEHSAFDVCFNCRQYGYWKSSCPTPLRMSSLNANNSAVNLLMNSTYLRVLIHSCTNRLSYS